MHIAGTTQYISEEANYHFLKKENLIPTKGLTPACTWGTADTAWTEEAKESQRLQEAF